MRPSLRTSDIVAEAVAAGLLLAAMVFGGGSRGAGDAVVHLFAIPALALAIVRWRHSDASRPQRLFVWWLLAAAAFVALQLLPMPVVAHRVFAPARIGDRRPASRRPAIRNG